MDVMTTDGRVITAGRRWPRALPAAAGAAYTLCWAIGLALPGPNLPVGAAGRAVIAGYSAHHALAAVQFGFTEGLPAFGLAMVAAGLARAARLHGALAASRLAAACGAGAAAVSLLQCALGVALAGWAVPAGAPGRAHLLFEAVTRLDGVKMLALAVLAAAAAHLAGRAGPLPGWLRPAGIALAATLTGSGIGYLLLNPALAALAYLSLPLLLIWVTSVGLALSRPRPGRLCPARG